MMSNARKENTSILPVTVVCVIILVAWYIAAIFMNTVVAEPKIEAAGGGFCQYVEHFLES